MGIADLFRPKWKHSSPAVRAEALQGMGAAQAEQIVELARTDPDVGIRRSALLRIVDPSLLATIADEESEPELSSLADRRSREIWIQRACSSGPIPRAEKALQALSFDEDRVAVILKAELPGIVAQAFDALEDDRKLVQLAKSAEQKQVRLRALDKLTEPAQLQTVVLSGGFRDVEEAALERIDEVDRIEQIINRCKSKALRARAKARLRVLTADEIAAAERQAESAKRARAEQARLLTEIESMVVDAAWAQHAEFDALGERWSALSGADPDFEHRFEAAVRKFAEGRRRARTEALREKLQPTEPPEAPPVPAVDTPTPTPAEPKASRPVASIRPERSSKAEHREVRKSRSSGPDPEKIEKLRAQLKTSLLGVCEELEACLAAEDRQRKSVEELLQRASSTAAKVHENDLEDSELAEALGRYETLSGELHSWVSEQQQDAQWHSWAKINELQKLISQAEAVLALEESPPELGAALKLLQSQWRAVKGVPRAKNEELWQKFKPLCDQIYERVKAQRAQRDEEVAANIEKKQALCDRAEVVAQGDDVWGCAEAIKQLQAEWKTLGVISHGREKAVWTRFRGICDEVFARRQRVSDERKSQEEANLGKKTQLIENIEALAAGVHDEDSHRKAIGETKQLQRRWKEIGHVPRRRADALFKKYRAACDAVYQRLESLALQEREAETARKQEQRSRLAAVVADESAATEALVQTWQDVFELGDAELIKQVRSRCETRLATDANAFAGTELALEASLRRKRKLCDRLDKMEQPEERDTPLAEQLQAALASNALGGAGSSRGELAGALASIERAWAMVGPTPGVDGTGLDERYAQAVAKLQNVVGESPGQATDA